MTPSDAAVREAEAPRRFDAPREDLVRMSQTLRGADDGSTLTGHAAVFGEWAEIDSWEGRFRERIAPGAFRKTLRERGSQIKVLFNHGMDPSIGDKPLGKPRVMREDDKGLYVEVPLDDTSYNADIRALLRSGALDGMSIRMTVVQEEWDNLDDEVPERTIKEIRLHEFGPVTFPAYAATTAGVRARGIPAFEAWRSATAVEAPPTPDPTPGPDDESTRSDADDSATGAAEHSTPTYQPARPTPMSRERRESQRRLVRAWASPTRSAP